METTNGNRLNWLWGLILIFLGAAFLLTQTLGLMLGELVWAIIMAGVAATLLAVYTANREQRWVLIPAYVFGALAGLLALVTLNMGNRFTPDLIPIYVMFAIALPFLVVFIRNPRDWWALIPGGIMAAIGLGLVVNTFELVIPAALIVAGLFLLVRALGGERRAAEPVETPHYGPETDRVPPAPPQSGPEADHE